MSEKIVFIINPISGKGLGKIIEPQIQEYFQSKPYSIETIFADYPGHAIALTQLAVKQNPKAIVACGGDGTINEVAQALIGQNIPLGILPLGSGNGLASNLAIPKEIEKALDLIINAPTHVIDVGRIQNHYFFSNAGFGIDAQVIHRYASAKQRNFIGYLKASLWSFLHYKPQPLQFSVEGNYSTAKSYFFVMISNSNEAGYGISFTPNAKLNDGVFDIVAIEQLNFFEFIQFAWCVIRKQIPQMKKATTFQTHKIEIISKKDVIIAQIDGEPFEIHDTSIQLQIIPKALQVLTFKNI